MKLFGDMRIRIIFEKFFGVCASIAKKHPHPIDEKSAYNFAAAVLYMFSGEPRPQDSQDLDEATVLKMASIIFAAMHFAQWG